MEQTLKILIADENNEFRNKTKAALKQLGFTRFEEAVSGEDALQIINRFHPDVVLLDVSRLYRRPDERNAFLLYQPFLLQSLRYHS